MQIRLPTPAPCATPAIRCSRPIRCATCRWFPTSRKRACALNGESAELHRAWYRGKVAKFFSFDEAPLAAAGGNVPLSPIYVTFNVNPGQPNGGPASGFRTEPNSRANSQRPVHAAGRRGILSVVAGVGLRQRRFSVGARSGNGAQGQGARSWGGDSQLPDRFHWALVHKTVGRLIGQADS